MPINAAGFYRAWRREAITKSEKARSGLTAASVQTGDHPIGVVDDIERDVMLEGEFPMSCQGVLVDAYSGRILHANRNSHPIVGPGQ